MTSLGLSLGVRLTPAGGSGGVPISAFSSVFRHNFIGANAFTDTHGNTISSTALRQSSANVTDYSGALITVPQNVHRVPYGRYAGGVWYDDDGAGNALHPSKTYLGDKIYLDIQAYATGQVVPAGGMRENGGRYYSTVLGGTTNGATPLVDTGVTDWVDQGIYHPEFGHLMEPMTTNVLWPSNDIIAPWGGVSAATPNGLYTTVTDTGASYISVARMMSGLPATTSNWIAKVLIRKGSHSGNNACEIKLVNSTGANNTTSRSVQLAPDGTPHMRLDSPGGAVIDQDYGVIDYGIDWLLWIRTPGNGTDTAFAINFWPAITDTAHLGSAFITASGSVDVRYFNLCQEDTPSTPVLTTTAPVIRYEEQGMVKYPTTGTSFGGTGFNHASGTLVASMVATNPSSVVPAAYHGLFYTDGVGGVNSILSDNATIINANDGTLSATATISGYSRNDAMQFAVQWDSTANQFRVGYRNATTGTAWAWSAYATYDGAFTDTGLFQFLTASNVGWTVRNTLVYPRPLTTLEMAGFVVS